MSGHRATAGRDDTVGGDDRARAGGSDRELGGGYNAAYRLADVLMRLAFERYLTGHVTGREHLPAPGTPSIIAANHSSGMDVFAAGYAIGRPAHFVAKVEATRIPLFGRYLLALGAVPANRDQRDTAVLRRMVTVLRRGGMIGLAPEGTRSPDGRLMEFDPGFVWLALRTDAAVVPCAIHGAYQLMPKGTKLPRRGPVWVRFGAPMTFADEGKRVSRERMAELAATVRERTLLLLSDLADETGIPNPAVVAGAADPQ